MKKESDFFATCDQERLTFYNERYHDNNMSWSQIAEMVGTYANKVRRDAKRLGVRSRDRSEAQKIAIAEGRHEHPTKGKALAEETKIKISKSQGKVWDSLTEEEREHRSKIGVESWNKKTDADKEEFFKKSVEAIQEASKKGSKMERHLFDFLSERGFRVDRHKEHVLQNEKFHIDLYIPSCRTAIEVDGPMHFEAVFGEEKLQKRQAADSQKNGLVLASGMVLIRVKLTKRESQRYVRETSQKVLSLLNKIKEEFPKKNERYFEV